MMNCNMNKMVSIENSFLDSIGIPLTQLPCVSWKLRNDKNSGCYTVYPCRILLLLQVLKRDCTSSGYTSSFIGDMQMSNLPFLHQGCALHSGVIKHASDVWSCFIFSSTLPIRMNWEKAYAVSAPHSCTIAFAAAAAFLLKYVQICLLCLTANTSLFNTEWSPSQC